MNPLPKSRPALPELPFEAPPTSPPGAAPERQTPATAGASCAVWDHCPNCGARLVNQRCTYRCPQCHYFMSCSDFD